MSKYVPIKTETLTNFADAARKTGNVETELSTEEMLGIFENAKVIKNQDITIVSNGVYTADSGYTGFGTVTVEVDNSLPENARLYYVSTAQSVMEIASTKFESSASGAIVE